MQGFLYFLLIILIYIGLPIIIIVFFWRFKRIAVIFIGLILIEQVSLKIMEITILKNHKVIKEFAAKNTPLPNGLGVECNKKSIGFIYYYKICLEYTSGVIFVNSPTGYLTLVYWYDLDKFFYDSNSKRVALLNHDGTIRYINYDGGKNDYNE